MGKLRHARTLEVDSERSGVSFSVVLIVPGSGLSVSSSSCMWLTILLVSTIFAKSMYVPLVPFVP